MALSAFCSKAPDGPARLARQRRVRGPSRRPGPPPDSRHQQASLRLANRLLLGGQMERVRGAQGRVPLPSGLFAILPSFFRARSLPWSHGGRWIGGDSSAPRFARSRHGNIPTGLQFPRGLKVSYTADGKHGSEKRRSMSPESEGLVPPKNRALRFGWRQGPGHVVDWLTDVKSGPQGSHLGKMRFFGVGLTSDMDAKLRDDSQDWFHMFKWIGCSFLGVFLLPMLMASCHASELEPKRDVINENFEYSFEIPQNFPPLRDLSLPPYQKFELGNGLKVLLLEDHELGLVSGKLLVRGGSKLDPEGKIGLSSLTSVVQRSGGTLYHPADDLNSILENKAASVETNSSTSQMSVAFNCLSEDIDDVFPLFAEVVRYPLMPVEKLDLAKNQFIGGILRRNDDPGAISNREISRLLYGDSSPFSRLSRISTVKNVNNLDLIDFHNATFRPRESILVVWGDFDTENFLSSIQNRFSDWENTLPEKKNAENNFDVSKTKQVALEPGKSNFEKGIYLYDKPEMTQGYIKIGELGINFFDPDIFSLDVLNSILNGFGGKLFDQIRSKEGLAYSVFGGFSPAIEHRGTFIAGGETKIEMITKFIAAMNGLLKDVTSEKPSPEELERAKDSALNSFVFNFSNNGSQMSRIASYELFGIDQNFIFDYKKGIENVNADDVVNAAKRNLHPKEQPIVVVTSLTSLGRDFDERLHREFDLPVFRIPLDNWE